MKNKPKSVDEMFQELFMRVGVKLTEVGWRLADEELDITKQAIFDLIKEGMPKEICEGDDWATHFSVYAHNKALQDTLSSIAQVLGVEK